MYPIIEVVYVYAIEHVWVRWSISDESFDDQHLWCHWNHGLTGSGKQIHDYLPCNNLSLVSG